MHTFAHVKTLHIHLQLYQVQAEIPPVEPSVTFTLDLIPASALTDKHTHADTKHTHTLSTPSDSFYKHIKTYAH